jgi:hypothetical protein
MEREGSSASSKADGTAAPNVVDDKFVLGEGGRAHIV